MDPPKHYEGLHTFSSAQLTAWHIVGTQEIHLLSFIHSLTDSVPRQPEGHIENTSQAPSFLCSGPE